MVRVNKDTHFGTLLAEVTSPKCEKENIGSFIVLIWHLGFRKGQGGQNLMFGF